MTAYFGDRCGASPICDSTVPQAFATARLVVAAGDGSVHTLRPTVSPQVWYGLLTPNGGEVANPDW
jgi:hypothetical protein